ncbi:AT-rich interactive domain-containing protein [Schistosoma japonicum]|uniref:AT-rich interactive domain-containing protein n=2 Tax=Schistosoma japonicum TaxID=6182 RepID=A0A4Z2DHB3_SCHJA|nr:AT-rich interactive domain-containing protein [Schistosoma japonicum]
MCDLLSQPQQQRQQRTGQKLSDRQLNKSQTHLSVVDSNNNTSVEMSSNSCTNSNRFNSSTINSTNRPSKSNPKHDKQKSDMNSLVANENSIDSVDSSSGSSNGGGKNENSNSRGNTVSKDKNLISINGDLQQQQTRCLTKTLETLTDINSHCSIVEQRTKKSTSQSFDGIELIHSNHSDSTKHDHFSVNSSKSPPSSPSSSSVTSSPVSSHSHSHRNNENPPWNNSNIINKDINATNLCITNSQADMTDKQNILTADNLVHGKSSIYCRQHRRQYNKSYCKSENEINRENTEHQQPDEQDDGGMEEKGDGEDHDDKDACDDEQSVHSHMGQNNGDADDSIDDDNDNSYLNEQEMNHYSTSLSTLTSDSLNSCISPMLAAAAMAALTTGCFPTSCNQLNQLNYSLLSKSYGIPQLSPPPPSAQTLLPPPPPSSSSAYSQRLQMTKQQQSSFLNSPPNRHSKANGAHYHHQYVTSNNNINISSLSSTGCNSFPTALHSSHLSNHNHNCSDDYNPTNSNNHSSSSLTTTPPPPHLSSRSNSPHPSTRLLSSNHLTFMSQDDDDVDEQDDELESEEVEDIEEIENSTQGNNHQWTFEEQFKQLYVISDDPKRKEFLDELFVYMQRRGTPVNRIPIMAKQVLDLYELFQLVVARGGLVEVINKKLWREITKGLNLPSSITSAAFTLRTQYMKYLYPYECETLGLSSPNELQAAIDGNRREARRSSYTFDYPMMNVPNTSRSTSPASTTNLQTTTITTGTSTTTTTSNTLPNSPSPLNINSSLSNSVYPNPLAFPNNGTHPDVNQLLSNLPTDSTPFCPNTLGFNTQFGQFNPFLTIPTGSLPTNVLPIQPPSIISSSTSSSTPLSVASSNQTGNNQASLFPSHFFPPMVSGSNFPLIGPNFQGFTATMNNPDDPFMVSSSSAQSGTLLSNVPNSFADPNAMAAAAAAAATLFSAGFPTLPGAFSSTTPPSVPPGLHPSLPITTTLTTIPNNPYLVNSPSLINSNGCLKFPTLNNLRNQTVHSTSNVTSIDMNEGNGSRGLRSKNKLALHDTDDCQFTSSLPLNLTANETGIQKIDEKGTSYLDNDSRSSTLMQLDHEKLNKLQYDDDENESFILHSNERFMQKDGKDNLLNNFNENDSTRNHHKDDSDAVDDDIHNNHGSDDDDDEDDDIMHTDSSDIRNEHMELRSKSNPSGEINKRELTGTNSNNINNRLQQSNFSFENDEPNIKTAAQVACQQLWVAAAAAAAGLHCGTIKTPETNNYGLLTRNSNSPLKSNHISQQMDNSCNITNNNNNSSKQIHHSSYSKSSYSSNKKTHSRTPSHVDTPNAKMPKLSLNNSMNTSSAGSSCNEINGKQQSNTTLNLSKKSSESRRQNEITSISTNLNFNHSNNSSLGVNNNTLTSAQLSMSTQNFRIQTQPGARMGLPQNAMVVTMEIGNILYQGVLFGQLKR